MGVVDERKTSPRNVAFDSRIAVAVGIDTDGDGDGSPIIARVIVECSGEVDSGREEVDTAVFQFDLAA